MAKNQLLYDMDGLFFSLKSLMNVASERGNCVDGETEEVHD